MSDVGC